jgi:hypothetical protein
MFKSFSLGMQVYVDGIRIYVPYISTNICTVY